MVRGNFSTWPCRNLIILQDFIIMGAPRWQPLFRQYRLRRHRLMTTVYIMALVLYWVRGSCAQSTPIDSHGYDRPMYATIIFRV